MRHEASRSAKSAQNSKVAEKFEQQRDGERTILPENSGERLYNRIQNAKNTKIQCGLSITSPRVTSRRSESPPFLPGVFCLICTPLVPPT
jgi:hypothetical protein